MSYLTILLAFLITTAFAQSPPPVSLKGQQSASKLLPKWNLQVPNNSATSLGGIDALVETGNNNILSNPSFEHSTFDTSWTSTTVTPAVETTAVIHGKKSLCFVASSQAFTLTQSSTAYAAQFADGVQGIAMLRLRTNHTGLITICSISAGTVSTTNCVTASASNLWGHYKLPTILGATSNGISVSAASGTGTTCIDDASVAAADIKQDINQSTLAGESYFAGTTNCNPTRSSATVAGFTADTDCPGPTIVYQGMGIWATTDANLLRQSVGSLPPGRYRAVFSVPSNTSTGTDTVLSINDGTSTCEPTVSLHNGTAVAPQEVSCMFNYTSQGDRVFELYGASGNAAAFTIWNLQTSPRASTKFRLEYYGSGQVYTSSCGANCEDVLSFKMSSAGVVSGENIDWISTCNSTSPYTCNFNASAGFTVAPNCWADLAEAASYGHNVTSTASTVVLQYASDVEAASTIYCQKQGVDMRSTRTIVGSFSESVTTAGVVKPSLVSASVSSSEAITEDSSVFLASCTNADPAVCTLTASFFTADPKCWANPIVAGTIAAVTGDTTTTVTVDRTDASTAFTLFCHGAR